MIASVSLIRHLPSTDDPRQIDVGNSDWKRGSGDEVLYTSGLDTCIGVAISGLETLTGHLGHFGDAQDEIASLDAMLAAAVGDTAKPAELPVWIRGGATFGDRNDVARSRSNRKLVLSRIAAFGLHNPNVKWAGKSGICYSAKLYCATGKCAIEAVDW